MTIHRLSSGYWHMRGRGPCNWAQTEHWPCTPEQLDAGFFAEAGATFRRDCHALLAQEQQPNAHDALEREP